MVNEGRTNKDYGLNEVRAIEETGKPELKIKNWAIGNRQ
jgi:hypothetical protein